MEPTLDPIDRTQLAATLAAVGQRLDANAFENFLRACAVVRADAYGIERLDANETQLFGPQLEFISGRIREVRRPLLKWRSFVPVASEAPPGAETWSYYLWDAIGMAEIVANYADDVRKVAASAKKFSYDIESYALGYDFSVLDIERAAVAGINYRNRKAEQVKKGFERRYERIAALGQPGVNQRGLLNNVNVPLINAAVVGGSSVWGSAGKSPLDVLNDIQAHEDAIILATNEVEAPDTFLLPLAKLRYIQNTPLYTGAGSRPEDTILKVYLDRSKYITSVDSWSWLDKANAAGTGARSLMYKRDQEHVHFEMPMPPRELPAQPKGLAVVVDSWSRAGGVVYEYPLSAAYMDGI